VNKYGDNMYAGLGVTVGSVSSPGVYFNGFTNSGFYSPSSGDFAISVSGTQRLNVSSGGINVTGVVTCTDVNSTSDYNLKNNIETLQNSLNIIQNIRGVKFEWKENSKKSIGVIAQEIQEILPELVSDTEVRTVNYNGLIAVAIEAIKEQQQQINTLNNKIAVLEKNIIN